MKETEVFILRQPGYKLFEVELTFLFNIIQCLILNTEININKYLKNAVENIAHY